MLNVDKFRKQVIRLCNERGLSIWEVSRQMGRQRSWLYERMQSKDVRMSTVRQVAKYFKVSPAIFLNGSSNHSGR